MSQKINLQELSALLSEKSGITKREAEVFLKEYFDTMEKALVEDGLLKVKNIGTFKLTLVNDRASVDVTTGERVVIPAHYKISYVPDNRLSEIINEPFALFESVAIPPQEDGDLELVTEEVVSEALPEEEISDVEELVSEEESAAIEEVEEAPAEMEIVTPSEEPMEEEEIITVVDSESPDEQAPVEEEEEPEEEEKSTMDYFSPVDDNRKRRKINWFAIVSTILLLAMGGVLYFVHLEEKRMAQDNDFLFPDLSYNSDDVISKDTVEDIAMPAPDIEEAEEHADETTDNAPPASPPTTTPQVEKEEPKPIPVKEEPKPAQTPTSKSRILKSGETLRIIAEQELGSREFWVYIYLKNKDRIKNPNVVSVGVNLRIPDKSEFGGINASDPASIQRAKNESAKIK